MADHDIITSQSLLKELEERMYSLYKLVCEVDIVIFNLKQTWTALSVTHGNFKQDAKED